MEGKAGEERGGKGREERKGEGKEEIGSLGEGVLLRFWSLSRC